MIGCVTCACAVLHMLYKIECASVEGSGPDKCSNVNSYILYRDACCAEGKRPLTALDFQRSITEDLAQEHLQQSTSHPSVGRHWIGPTPTRLNKRLHLLEERATYHNCVVCSGAIRHTTHYFCKTCPDQPALHPVPCFERYHTLQHYRC